MIAGRKSTMKNSSTIHLTVLFMLVGVAQLASMAPTTAIPHSSETFSEFEGSLGVQDDPVRTIHYHFEKQMEPYLHLHKFNSSTFRGNTVTCNDGSPAGYYKRLNNQSKSWIIYLQGGGFCGSEEACQQRWRQTPHLMSSNFWPKSKSLEGILSSEPKDNPFLWNANHIYVPYCSSDSWTGHQSGRGGLISPSDHDRNSDHHHHHHYLQNRHTQYNRNSFAFMGSTIVERVFESLFEELPRDSGLYEGKFILLSGDSAGATGVILNLDKLNKLVQLKFSSQASRQGGNKCNSAESDACQSQAEVRPAPVFRGLADSGWFLDNEPYDYAEQQGPSSYTNHPTTTTMTHRYLSSINNNNNNNNNNQAFAVEEEGQQQTQQQQQNSLDCDRQLCGPLQATRQAMLYWNGQVPEACAQQYTSEPWRCYFGYRAYQTLKTPLFVVQWLYDEAQLIVDNIGRPDTIGQWNYVQRLVGDMRASLENVTALFAPSCFSHSLINKQSWNQININGLKLPHILNSWEEETLANQPTIEALSTPTGDASSAPSINNNDHQQYHSDGIGQQQISNSNLQQPTATSNLSFRSSNQPQQQPPATISRSSRSRKRKRNNHNQHQKQLTGQSNRLSRSTSMVSDSDQTVPMAMSNNNVPHLLSAATNKLQQESISEKFRLIDSCGWPQCNRDCPVIDQEIIS